MSDAPAGPTATHQIHTSGQTVVTAWAAIEGSSPAPRLHAGPDDGRRRQGGLGTSLRPRTVSTVIDEGGRIARRHGATIFTISTVLLVPAAVIEVFAAQTSRRLYSSGSNPLGSFRIAFGSQAQNDAGQLTAFVGLGLAAYAALLIGAYVAGVVSADHLGGVFTRTMAVRRLLRRVPALTLAWLVTHSWIALVLLGGQSSGDLAAFVSILSFPFALFSTYLAPVMMLEAAGPFRAIRRSSGLAKRTFGTTLGFFLLSGAVGLWFRFGMALFPSVLRQLLFTDRFQWLVEGVGAQLGIVVSAPIVACATTAMYLDIRTRTEGIDITLESQRVFGDG